MTRKFGGSAVLEIPTWCGRKLQAAASHHKLPPGSVSGPEISADSSHTTRSFSARFSTWLPLVSTFAGTGPTSEKRISSRSLTIGLHWPIAANSPQTIEQGRWFQPVGEIFINKGQTNRSILCEKKRCWHRQLP
jgi:hypothetical protein